MSKVLIIGAGGVGGVVAHKCAQLPEVFSEIVLASRTLSRCERIQAEVAELQGRRIEIGKGGMRKQVSARGQSAEQEESGTRQRESARTRK